MTKKEEKNLYIRCSLETYELAHRLAENQNRSMNKQIIHMIHEASKELSPVEKKTEKIDVPDANWGLTRLAETRKSDS